MAKKKVMTRAAKKTAGLKQNVTTVGRQKESKAKTAAKKRRSSASGLTRRILGHVAARTRRKQAKRDAGPARRKQGAE
jgi:hypothetical protein